MLAEEEEEKERAEWAWAEAFVDNMIRESYARIKALAAASTNIQVYKEPTPPPKPVFFEKSKTDEDIWAEKFVDNMIRENYAEIKARIAANSTTREYKELTPSPQPVVPKRPKTEVDILVEEHVEKLYHESLAQTGHWTNGTNGHSSAASDARIAVITSAIARSMKQGNSDTISASSCVSSPISSHRRAKNAGQIAKDLTPSTETPPTRTSSTRTLPTRTSSTKTPSTRAPSARTSSTKTIRSMTLKKHERDLEHDASALFYGKTFVLTTSSGGSGTMQYNKQVMSDKIRNAGGTIVDDVADISNVENVFLIADKPCYTFNYIAALARAIPCVSFTWINECIKRENFVRVNRHILGAGSANTPTSHPASKDSNLLLAGKKVAVRIMQCDNGPETLSQKKTCPTNRARLLVQWLGGTLTTPSDANLLVVGSLALVGDESKNGKMVITVDHLIKSISAGRLLPFPSNPSEV